MNYESIRREFTFGTLNLQDLDKDPIQFFEKWMGQAIKANCPEPTAMSVSTVGSDGFPQSRIVLLKSADESGFTFFTNYQSQKGESIKRNPSVALLFFWPELQRQVRVTGTASLVTEQESASYFSSRPVASRIGAWVSEQSKEIPSRDYLERRFSDLAEKFRNTDITKPDHWGGYRVRPFRIEFWQGRENRLHDRFLYEKQGNGWIIKRLAP